MSEPSSAFLKLHIPRQNLVRWLGGPVRPAATWSDWRQIGGSYYFRGGPRDIAEISEDEMAEKVEECDTGLRQCRTNRHALRIMLDFGEAKLLKRCSYDDATMEFVIGTLAYAENLIRYMQFLAVARGAADALEPDGTGVALLHNYIWSPNVMGKAMKLGPGPRTAFMGPDAHRDAIPLFQPIADAILAASEDAGENPDDGPEPFDLLDRLK